MKIVNMNKFIRMIIIVVAISGIAIFIGLNKAYSTGEVKYKEESVTNGDTLWGIYEKQQKTNQYFENKDIRDIVAEIKYTNNLENGNLEIGQKINIPII